MPNQNDLLDDLNELNKPQELIDDPIEEPQKLSAEELDLLKLKKFQLPVFVVGVLLFFIVRYFAVSSWNYYECENNDNQLMGNLAVGMIILSNYGLIVWLLIHQFSTLPLGKLKDITKETHWLLLPVLYLILMGISSVALSMCGMATGIASCLILLIPKFASFLIFGINFNITVYSLDLAFLISLIIGIKVGQYHIIDTIKRYHAQFLEATPKVQDTAQIENQKKLKSKEKEQPEQSQEDKVLQNKNEQLAEELDGDYAKKLLRHRDLRFMKNYLRISCLAYLILSIVVHYVFGKVLYVVSKNDINLDMNELSFNQGFYLLGVIFAVLIIDGLMNKNHATMLHHNVQRILEYGIPVRSSNSGFVISLVSLVGLLLLCVFVFLAKSLLTMLFSLVFAGITQLLSFVSDTNLDIGFVAVNCSFLVLLTAIFVFFYLRARYDIEHYYAHEYAKKKESTTK